MNKVAWVFHTPPHGIAAGREGLDAILATSAYSDAQALFFVGEGVLQLVKNQQPEVILSRDYIAAFKLLDLYDIDARYVCQQSLQRWGLSEEELLIEVEVLDPQALAQRLRNYDQLLTF
ncbi:sulfurtransferase complex subunit TusC [Vibrio metoecus]|uniref:Protein TusC homolog n=1 Tax=Vibrio metoecus TaxID=1481663 RepID=A0A271VPG0_VIBMT|nr:sulfurtransferase complex subunit TusC [Vibrio metoecus]KQB09017.1 sulfur relay protein TusC [Vibrio metoecus]PAR19455.1 sulfurtransferase TusC [Vibrio metoecus]PAR22337.1 sulfurtransferase TusC [Vibrio metoecus]